MTNFTILDGLMIMIVAMVLVFILIMGLWGVLLIMKKLLGEESDEQANLVNGQTEIVQKEILQKEILQKEGSYEKSTGKDSIPPETVALIISIVFEKHKEKSN